MEIASLVKISAGITTVFAVPIAIYRLARWLFPIKIIPGYRVNYDKETKDIIYAEIINKSKETQYITECKVRILHPAKFVSKTMLKSNIAHLTRLKDVKFCGQYRNLLKDKPTKIEPLELIKLSHELDLNHPLNYFLGPRFLIEVKLSNGRIIHSKPLPAPKRWLFTSKIAQEYKEN
jgi:hypothetical protein